MAKHYTKQVEDDIKAYNATGVLPRAWDQKTAQGEYGYWDWVHRYNGGIEPQYLRQDEIAEEEAGAIYRSNKFKQQAAELIHEKGPEWFTVREMLAYSLCYVDGLTEREAAAQMGVSQPRVFELKASIQKKLKKFLGSALSNDLAAA